MQPNRLSMPDGLGLRLARPSDNDFLQALFESTRDDLRMINAEKDFIDALINMQQRAQETGYGNTYPDALQFIVEKLGESIGRVIIDFGHNEIKVMDISLIRAARGKGYGKSLLQGLQQAAIQVGAPLALEVRHGNIQAKQLYLQLGFAVDAIGPITERMVWYPGTLAIPN